MNLFPILWMRNKFKSKWNSWFQPCAVLSQYGRHENSNKRYDKQGCFSLLVWAVQVLNTQMLITYLSINENAVGNSIMNWLGRPSFYQKYHVLFHMTTAIKMAGPLIHSAKHLPLCLSSVVTDRIEVNTVFKSDIVVTTFFIFFWRKIKLYILPLISTNRHRILKWRCCLETAQMRFNH